MGRIKEQALKRNYEEASTSRTTERAEPPPPRQQVEPNARGTRVLRGLRNEQLALVDVYKSKNLIGGTGIWVGRLGKSVAKTVGSLCVEFRLTFPYFSCTLPLFLGNGKNQRTSLEKEL